MAQCVVVNTDGSVSVSSADPCTSFVLLTPAEYDSATSSPFNLTLDQGALIAGAVAVVWVSGWAFKALFRVLNGGSSSSTSEG